MSEFVRRWGLLAVIVAVAAAGLAAGAWRWVSPDGFKTHHEVLKAVVSAHPFLAAAGFFAAFTAIVASCLPGPGLMATASGYLFGGVAGGLISLAASVAGSTLVFLACRRAFAAAIARRGGRLLRELEAAVSRNAFAYLLTLKLIPVAPYFLSNIAAGLAGVDLAALVWASVIGSAPVCFILAGLGAGLGHALDRPGPLDPHLLERPGVILPLVCLSLLAVASIGWRLARGDRR